MHALALALPLLFAVQPSADVGLRVRTEAQGARQAAQQPGFEGRLTPALHLGLESPRQELDLTWAPSFAWYDQMEGLDPFIIHEGTLDWRWDVSDQWLFDVAAEGRVGEESILSIFTDAPTEVDFVPTLVPLDIANLRGDLGLEWAAGARTSLRLQGGYLVQGGMTEEARGIYPLAYGPRGSLALTRALTPRDELEAEVFGGQTAFSASGPRAGIDGLTYRYAGTNASWIRALTPHTDLIPTVGVIAVRDVDDPSADGSLLPEATLGLTHEIELPRGNRLLLEGRAGATPDINRYGGRLEENLGGRGTIVWRRGERFRLGLGLGYYGVLYVDTGDSGTLGRGSLYGRYELVVSRLALEFGASGYTQRIPGDVGLFVNDVWNAHFQLVFTTGSEE